jgi:peptidoglycan-associated lipoprotein
MSARVVSLVLTVSVLGACSHHTPPAAAPAPAPSPSAPVAAAAPVPAAQPVNDDAARRAKADAARAALARMTFFAFNKSDLTDQDQTALAAKVPILAANPAIAIRIAGNCDDRGSDEYNLALGQRRAQASKRYLVDHGIADGRIATISYGKERPIAAGEDEAAWARNRNDQFEITAGSDDLRAAN